LTSRTAVPPNACASARRSRKTRRHAWSASRALRRALGAGATVDGDLVVVQGDLMARVQPWLAAHGARRIVAGN
jgi:translation initiation factor 1 (eIF-1/SUI1)